MQEMRVQSLGQENPLEEEMATHSSILALEIPWTEEPGRLRSVDSQRVGHDWATEHIVVNVIYIIFTLCYICSLWLLRWLPLNWPLGLQFFHPRVQLLSCSLRELSQMHSFLCYRKAPCFLYGVTGLQPFDRPLVTAQSSGCSARGCTPGFVTCSHPTAAASPPPAWPQPRPLHSSESKLPAVLAAPRVFLPLCLLRLPWGLHCPFSLVAWWIPFYIS